MATRTNTRRAIRGLVAGVALGAVAVAVVDAVRPRPGPARIVDWDQIEEEAVGRLDRSDAIDGRRLGSLQARYRKLAGDLEGALLGFVGGEPVALAPFEALDRYGWVQLNVGIMRDALEPLVAFESQLPNSRLVEVGRGFLTRYVGLILGFLSGRVLGQYDPQLLGREPAGRPGLYLVEPNIAAWEAEANLPGEALRSWLILHEMTHAWQFGAHPWLRDHLNGMLKEVLSAAISRRQGPVERVLAVTVGVRRQLEVITQVQATMSLVEGYSNLVMDVVGREVLADFEALDSAHQARAGRKTIFERLFWKLTGLELKLQQYVVGERFCRQINDRHGIAYLNRAWEGPAMLPTAAELREPELWARRVGSDRGRSTA